MRIISGIYRSRKLKPPPTDTIRPTSDRAKETLFNILSNEIDFKGIRCMDLFCGSGSLGLECLSRGASKCTFVDEDTRLVNFNINSLGVIDKCDVIEDDVLRFLDNNLLYDASDIRLILSDPPYDYEHYDLLLQKVSSVKGIFVLEHSKEFIPGSQFKAFQYNFKKVGTVNFTFYNFN